MSTNDKPNVGTPVKGAGAVGTPLKSAFLTPCRRMGLGKRKVNISLTTPGTPGSVPPQVTPGSSTPSASPLSKRPSIELDSTPKRKVIPKRKSLVVTRVEKPQSEAMSKAIVGSL
jgi:hypothetical protein